MVEVTERWGDDLTERSNTQEAFIDGILTTYGSQVFEVLPENLPLTLVDIQRRMEDNLLQWRVPPAVADRLQISPDTGDVEMYIYPSLTGNWIVALFPIFEEE